MRISPHLRSGGDPPGNATFARFRGGANRPLRAQSRPHSPVPALDVGERHLPRINGRLARESSLQEAIGNPSLHNGSWLVGLLLGVIAEQVRQHLGVEDAARR
jgi:hypothetical protein